MATTDTFRPVNQNLSEIFSGILYKVPNYQRQYSWGLDQLDAIWNDLYEAYKNKSPDNDCYFLGSIVTVKDKDGYQELIDGQQRLTTLMILMNVLLKDFSNINEDTEKVESVNAERLYNFIMYDTKRNRLKLQTDPKYDSDFNELIISKETFANEKKPTKTQLKIDDPRYKFTHTAVFFYEKLKELSYDDLCNFINYIFYNTNIIRIECTSQSFAIKLFQVLNDRGLDLSPADIVKSYIIGRCDDEHQKNIFSNNRKGIEDLAKEYDFKIDEFIVYYEYYKLRSNPKKQVIDELRQIIENENDIGDLVNEMKKFNDSLRKVCENESPAVLSLKYIPRKAYIGTALTTMYCVGYQEINELIKLIRRYYYIAFISGNTLNGIKQTSFSLISAIYEKRPIEEIRDLLEKNIIGRNMYKKMYDSLDGDVYGEKFLKPLLLSLEYENREILDTAFYKLDTTLHVDHILPRGYSKDNSWNHINENKDVIIDAINSLGNMALLQNIKNEEALNHGFDDKKRIYAGKDSQGNNKSGVTSFEFSRKILDEKIWNLDKIEERKKYLMKAIEDMLDIDRSMCDKKLEIDVKPKEFSEEQFKKLTDGKSETVIALYKKLDQCINILNIKGYHVVRYTTSLYVGYMLEGGRQFLAVYFTNKGLNCFCIHGTYKDPMNKVTEKASRDRTTDMHIAINNDFDLDYANGIIEQSYEKAIK